MIQSAKVLESIQKVVNVKPEKDAIVRSKLLSIIIVGLLFTATISYVGAQPVLGVSSDAHRDGFDIYSASAATAYSSYPGTFSSSTSNGGKVQGGYSTLAGVTLGYSHGGPNLKFAFKYSPSYAGAFYSSSLNSFNQSLSLEMVAKLSAKWAFSLAASGDDVTIDQFLFKQNGLSQLVAGSATVDEFASAVLSGSSTSLASSPQTLVFGTRILSYGVNGGFTYKPTTRFSVNINGGGYQSIARNHDNGSGQFLTPRTNVEHGGIALSYSLNPRTEIGVITEATQSHNALVDYRSFSYTGSYGRKLGTHWFASVQAGLGTYQYLGNKTALPSGASIVTSGTLGYKDRENAWAVTYNRMVGDVYGLASSSSSSVFGSWNWKKPGKKWALQAFGGQQRLLGSSMGAITIWHGSAAVSRSLNRQTSVSLAYGYMSDAVAPVLTFSNGVAHSVRLTIFWIPRQHQMELLNKQDLSASYESIGQNPKDSLFTFQPTDLKSITSDGL